MKVKKIILLTILTIIISFVFIKPIKAARATTFGDLLDNLEELKEEKRKGEEEKAYSEAEFARLTQEIKESQEKAEEYSRQIVEATNKIAELQEEIEKKKEETNKILVFLQLSSGEKSYLEYIFKATSFTDFIHRISVVEEISKYNKDLIKEMNDLIKQQEELKIELAEKIKLEEAARKELEAKQKQVGSRISDLYEEGANIDEKIKGQEEVIALYQANGCTERSDILSICMNIPPATGFLRPLPYGIITSDYGWRLHPVYGYYHGHTGVDIGGNGIGTPIYSVAPGKVAFTIHWDCGGNVVGVYHKVRGVDYTSIYMHLQSFAVSKGDIVTENDVIGYVGGYYDSCSTGPHLHLSMTYGHLEEPGNYRTYMFDPTEVLYFPSGWFYSRSW